MATLQHRFEAHRKDSTKPCATIQEFILERIGNLAPLPAEFFTPQEQANQLVLIESRKLAEIAERHRRQREAQEREEKVKAKQRFYRTKEYRFAFAWAKEIDAAIQAKKAAEWAARVKYLESVRDTITRKELMALPKSEREYAAYSTHDAARFCGLKDRQFLQRVRAIGGEPVVYAETHGSGFNASTTPNYWHKLDLDLVVQSKHWNVRELTANAFDLERMFHAEIGGKLCQVSF